MTRIIKNEQPIRDLEHWRRVGGPKRDIQWDPGRSAFEAARFWLDAGDTFPAEIGSCLEEHSDFGAIVNWWGEPEVRLRFDGLRGEPRNTDLLVLAQDHIGPILIAVEAKGDESFGQTLPGQLADALEARLENPRSGALQRIESLVRNILPTRAKDLPKLKAIRYQLLTSVAGALAEATRRGIDRVILLVQEFATEKTSDILQARNQADLDAFVARLTNGRIARLEASRVEGPLSISSRSPRSVTHRLYLLKIRCKRPGTLGMPEKPDPGGAGDSSGSSIEISRTSSGMVHEKLK